MKILYWNIRHGGGKRIDQIIRAIRSHNPDTIILGEFRNGQIGKEITHMLGHFGWIHQAVPDFENHHKNRVLVASRLWFEPTFFHNGIVDPELGDHSHRCVQVTFGDGLQIFGLYFPGKKRKHVVFDFLLDLPFVIRKSEALLIGDFNTGLPYVDEKLDTFHCVEKFQALLDQGWIDAWRTRNPADLLEGTWISPNKKNPFRLDHAFASPTLDPRIRSVQYSHSEREEGISDHSILMVDLESKPAGRGASALKAFAR